MALSCRTFRLVHLLIDYVFGATIRIVYGDPNGGNEDGHDGVRSSVKSEGYCAEKTTLPNKTFAPRVLQHPRNPVLRCTMREP